MVVVSPALCTPTSPYFSPWVRKSRRHRAIKLSVSNNLIDKGGGGVEQTECNVWILLRSNRQSIAFSPRAFRGEKVPKADEGCRAIGWHEVPGRRDVSAQLSFGNVAATSNAPSSDLRPPSPPQKAWGRRTNRSVRNGANLARMRTPTARNPGARQCLPCRGARAPRGNRGSGLSCRRPRDVRP